MPKDSAAERWELTTEEKIEAIKRFFEEIYCEQFVFAKCEDGTFRLISMLP